MTYAKYILGFTLAASFAFAENEDFVRSKKKLQQTLERFSSPAWVEGSGLSEVTSRIFGRGAAGDQPQVGPRPEDSLVQEKKADEKDGPPTGAASGPPAIGGTARTLPRWLPYCFLVDPAQDGQQVNQAIKTVVDEYAKCGVAIDVHAFTIQPGYPQNPDQLNELARQACDFGRAFEVRGAVQVWSGSPQIAQEMCDDEQAVGCSTLCERISVAQVAPGQGAYVAVHESLHSNCCGRACVDPGAGSEPAGYGVSLVHNHLHSPHELKTRWAETEQDVPRQGDEQTPPQQISQAACGAITAGAAENNGLHRYDPAKQTYYVAATDPAAMKELNGQSFFTAKPKYPPVPESGKGVGGQGGGGGLQSGDGQKISFNEAPKGRPTEASFRHQGKNDASVALLGNVASQSGSIRLTNPPSVGTGKGSPGPRISFDDSAKKRVSGDGGSNASSSYADFSGASSGFSADDATGDTSMIDTGAFSTPAGGFAGAKQARIGFNDNAAKGTGAGSLALPGAQGTAGYQGGSAGNGASPGGTDSGAEEGFGFSTIIQGASALASSLSGGDFWGTVGESEEEEQERKRRERGASLRSRDGRGIQRESDSGLKKRSDVLISSRPDPNFVTEQQTPYPGVY